MNNINELTDIQRRLVVDLRQAYEAYQSARQFSGHYAGSMSWRQLRGKDTLLRRIGKSQKSLGQRSPEREAAYEAFVSGKERAELRQSEQAKGLNIQAALAKAAGLGRVPRIVARILRTFDEVQILGHLKVVGTNALFAYEALAGVTFSGDLLATVDVDFVMDSRRRLRIMVPDADERTVTGLLRRVDKSFEIVRGRTYRLANNENFMVDIIRPQPNPAWLDEPGEKPLAEGDVVPSPIEGLQWLVNAPRVEAVAIDDNGYPTPFVVPDPRLWMFHKLWLSRRVMRDAVKKQRDESQALLVRKLLRRYLPQYPIDQAFLAGLPRPLAEIAGRMEADEPGASGGDLTPNW